MKVNLDHVFKLLDGKPIKNENADFTMRAACINCLTVNIKGEGRITGDEKVKRAELAARIFAAGPEIDLKKEEVKVLKELIAILGSPLVVKQSWDILDPKTKN